MAWLEKDPSGMFHLSFRFGGRKFRRTLKTTDADTAHARKTQLEETVRLVENGRIEIPKDADVGTFLLSDGKHKRKIVVADDLTLKQLFTKFFDALPNGNLESSTINGMHIHKRHLFRHLGEAFSVQQLTRDDLQNYVNKRSVESGKKGETVSGNTINKELVTFGTVWRSAAEGGKLYGPFPRKGVRLPKFIELPPFQTWQEIERQVQQESLDEAAASLLWDSLYLRRNEIDQLLADVDEQARYAFIYPMFTMAAHAGTRRSEMLRSRVRDFDFNSSVVTIRERKRVRGVATTRRVPLSPTLATVMREWFNGNHSGGPYTFCHPGSMPRSNGQQSAQLTTNQAHSHFETTLRGTKWNKIKGWHCLRHSFISNLACVGVDQRIIDEFAGHTTEQMRRRYRHLFPNVKQAAIEKVFG